MVVVEVETVETVVETEEIVSEEVEVKAVTEEDSVVATEEVASAEEETARRCRCHSGHRSPRDKYRRTQVEEVMEEEEDLEEEVDSEASGEETVEEKSDQRAVAEGAGGLVVEEAQVAGSAEARAEGPNTRDGNIECTACTVTAYVKPDTNTRTSKRKRNKAVRNEDFRCETGEICAAGIVWS